jgi:hypothetical protein
MYVLLIFETLLRQRVGHMKLVTFAHTPAGAIRQLRNPAAGRVDAGAVFLATLSDS